MHSVILINILIQSTLEAYQRNTSITLIGRWNRVAGQILYKCHPLPACGGNKARQIIPRPAVTRFSLKPYRLRPPDAARRGIVMNHHSPASGSIEIKFSSLSCWAIYCSTCIIVGGSDQIMARKTGTVGNNGIADINSRLLAQNLANGIRSRPARCQAR
ncbi:Uncharacterised protein [Salmonella enterica subsp. enterica]|uniref:Uncharacterized protein n=1 Tax=Salmonella enterica I TaxID=59201 RepID=A0A447TUT5_SALET|nr:Uncharacterised protein [Salmonella enterica subsp. enterica]